MKNLLFNPFEKIQTTSLLIFGLTALIIGSVLAYYFNARYDGIVDVHFVENVEIHQPFFDNGINTLVLGILLFLAGIIVNTKTRFIDILCTVLVSRFIFYLMPLFNVNNYMFLLSNKILQGFGTSLNNPVQELSTGNIFYLVIFSIITILALIWSITLLYQGYKVASHAKGTLAIVLFITAFIVAELASKMIISNLY